MTLTQTLVDDQAREWAAETAIVESTHLGLEDHNIFAVNLNFTGVSGGWGQGMGHIGVDDGMLDGRRLFSTAVGLYLIEAILDTVGRRTWEAVKGTHVLVLRKAPYAQIQGIASLDGARTLIFSDLWPDK